MLNYKKDANLPQMTDDEFCEFERNFAEQWSAEWTYFTTSKPEDYGTEEIINKQENKVHEA